MIALAIARKNLACLISNPNSFHCKSPVSFFLSIHNFTTSTEKRDYTSSQVYDVLVHNHHFSPESAPLAASDLTRYCSPERADSLLTFLKGKGFSSTQLEKVVMYKHRILGVGVEDVKLKFKIFQDLGFSLEEAVVFFVQDPGILLLDVESKIIPTLSVLKDLLGSDRGVVRVLKKSSWFLSSDMEKTLLPNIEILKSCGISMEHIIYLMYKYPRCLLKSDILRKSFVKVREMGVIRSPTMFILAVGVIASTKEGTWDLKFRALQDLGFSDSDILKMFKKAPPAFFVSTVKMKKVTELLLATGKFDRSSLVNYPSSFGRSIEKRLKPRLQILEYLESRDLIEKWPTLSTISVWPDVKFSEMFVEPYSDKLGENESLRIMSKTKPKLCNITRK